MLWLEKTLLLALVGKVVCCENIVLQDSLRAGDEKHFLEALDFSNLFTALKIYPIRSI